MRRRVTSPCLRASSKLFTALLFASLFLFARRWRDKIRGSIAVYARFINEESEDEICDSDCDLPQLSPLSFLLHNQGRAIGTRRLPLRVQLTPIVEACTMKVRIVSGSSVSMRTTPKLRKAVAPKCAVVSTSKKAVQPSAAKIPVVRSAAKATTVRSAKGAKLSASGYDSTTTKIGSMLAEITLQNQAVKRLKLDKGKARQIINVNGRALPHKSKLGRAGGTDLFTYTGRNYRE